MSTETYNNAQQNQAEGDTREDYTDLLQSIRHKTVVTGVVSAGGRPQRRESQRDGATYYTYSLCLAGSPDLWLQATSPQPLAAHELKGRKVALTVKNVRPYARRDGGLGVNWAVYLPRDLRVLEADELVDLDDERGAARPARTGNQDGSDAIKQMVEDMPF